VAKTGGWRPTPPGGVSHPPGQPYQVYCTHPAETWQRGGIGQEEEGEEEEEGKEEEGKEEEREKEENECDQWAMREITATG
jgi:hypothetical protein